MLILSHLVLPMLILGPLAQSGVFLASLAIQGSPWLILEYSWPVLLMLIQCSSCSFSAPHAHSGHPWLILGVFLDILGNSGHSMLILGLPGSFWGIF